MMSVLFRTNAGAQSGLGHLVRCMHLADQLLLNNVQVHVVLDNVEPGVEAFLPPQIKVHELYSAPQAKLDEQHDAERVADLARRFDSHWVILDDYRIGKPWEQHIHQAHIPLCVIDDLLRPHQCDLVIDMRWRGPQTSSAYDTLVPSRCHKLLGPAFTLLSSAYREAQPVSHAHRPFQILLSLGGGGDMNQLHDIVHELISTQGNFSCPIHISVIIGPLAENAHYFRARYENTPNVSLIVGETNLYPIISATDLYIGAAGGTLYQLLALEIPAITFALADNQEGEPEYLEDIGHYFHIGRWSKDHCAGLGSFVNTAIEHYQRLKQLQQQAWQRVDGRGTVRISRALRQLGDTVTAPRLKPAPADETTLSEQHQIRPVCDADINHYLRSRNLPKNSQNMIRSDAIPVLEHASWWFQTRRDSYLLSKQNMPCLYIWHELKHVNDNPFLIGGWFVCTNESNFQDALLALSWQLDHCDRCFPNVPWIAVIHRQNKFVRLLNTYLGFNDIDADHPYHGAVQQLFANADSDDFFYVTRTSEPESRDK